MKNKGFSPVLLRRQHLGLCCYALNILYGVCGKTGITEKNVYLDYYNSSLKSIKCLNESPTYIKRSNFIIPQNVQQNISEFCHSESISDFHFIVSVDG